MFECGIGLIIELHSVNLRLRSIMLAIYTVFKKNDENCNFLMVTLKMTLQCRKNESEWEFLEWFEIFF